MLTLQSNDPVAMAVVSAIQKGDVDGLKRLLTEHSDLAKTRIVDVSGTARSLLHVAADWPGHFANGAQTVTTLVAAGADVNASMSSTQPKHAETPLHWAASSNDIAVLDALLDGGADIEAPGAVFTDGSPMSDAVVFAQWDAARRLLERGARTTFWQAASLGLLDRVQEYLERQHALSTEEITNAFWHACRGGQLETAQYLLARGAELNWIGYDKKTPLNCALESGRQDVVAWLRGEGATSA